MIAEYYTLPEIVINNGNSDIYQKLDSLEESYKEVIKLSVNNEMYNFCYQARQLYFDLKEQRRRLSKNENFLRSLFLSYDEKLFFLCLNEDGRDFVNATHLPECVLM